MDEMWSEDGIICIQRSRIIQDLVRRYTVFIDGTPVDKLAPLQTGRYTVTPGTHSVKLRIGRTGHSRSDEFSIDVLAGETRTLRTISQPLSVLPTLPLGAINPDRFAPRPWIRLVLEPRRESQSD